MGGWLGISWSPILRPRWGVQLRPGLVWVPLRDIWLRLAERVEGIATGPVPSLFCFLSHLLRDSAGDLAFAGSDSGWYGEDGEEPTGRVQRATTFIQL